MTNMNRELLKLDYLYDHANLYKYAITQWYQVSETALKPW